MLIHTDFTKLEDESISQVVELLQSLENLTLENYDVAFQMAELLQSVITVS